MVRLTQRISRCWQIPVVTGKLDDAQNDPHRHGQP
jgi:hypothetical protein